MRHEKIRRIVSPNAMDCDFVISASDDHKAEEIPMWKDDGHRTEEIPKWKDDNHEPEEIPMWNDDGRTTERDLYVNRQ